MSTLQADLRALYNTLQGAKVHVFDPDASPNEKAMQAKQSAASIAPVDMSALPSLRGEELKQFKNVGGTEMETDIDSSKPDTTTDLTAADALSIAKAEGRIDSDNVPSPPGAMPASGKVRESQFAVTSDRVHGSEADISLLHRFVVPSWFAIVCLRASSSCDPSMTMTFRLLRRDGQVKTAHCSCHRAKQKLDRS